MEMTSITLIVFIFCVRNIFADGGNDKVYWEQWDGKTIPEDVFIGGYGDNSCGMRGPIYLGTLFEDEKPFTSVYLYHKATTALYTDDFFQQQNRIRTGVKLLCTKDPEIVTWVPIAEARDKLNSTAHQDCVLGGTEYLIVYYGKTQHDNQDYMGKITPDLGEMIFPYYGQGKKLKNNFEILCYTKAWDERKKGTSV